MIKKIVYFIGIMVLLVVIAGIVKFNFINDDVYVPDGKGGYVNEYGKKTELKYDENISTEEFNQKAQINSKHIASQIEGLPKELEEKILFMGNPKADMVLVYAQGGPELQINPLEIYSLIRFVADIDMNRLLIADVHQCQTLKTEEYSKREITFEEAKECDKESAKYIADTVEFFKNKRHKKVVVLGVSFGAFVVQDYLARFDNIADGIIIAVGRLNMPKEIWSEFAKGNSVGFEYEKNGTVTIKPIPMREAGMGGENKLIDKNCAKLAAGLGYKRYIGLLKKRDLSHLVYIYGDIDEQVGRLSDKEINFLRSKQINPLHTSGGHFDTVGAFMDQYLKELLFGK